MPTNPSALIGELAALADLNLAYAKAHAELADRMHAPLREVPSLALSGDVLTAGASILATNARRLAEKSRALTELYRDSRVSATPPQQPQALDGAIWLPLHTADTEGGHAD